MSELKAIQSRINEIQKTSKTPLLVSEYCRLNIRAIKIMRAK